MMFNFIRIRILGILNCLLLFSTISFAQSIQDIHKKYRAELDTMQRDTNRIKKLLFYTNDLRKLNLDSCLPILATAETESRKMKFQPGIARCAALRGLVAMDKGEQERAIQYFKESVSTYEALNRYRDIGSQYHNMAMCYNSLGQLQQSADAFLKSAHFMELAKDTAALGNVYNGLGVTFVDLSQFDKALEWYDKAIKLAEQTKDTTTVVMIKLNTSVLYAEKGDTARTLRQLQEALQSATQIKYEEAMAIAYQSLAVVHSAQNRFDTALYYFKKAENWMLQHSELKLGSLYKAWAQTCMHTNSFKEARDMALKSIRYAEKYKELLTLGVSYVILSEAYESMGQYKEGLAAYRKGRIYKDSLRDQETINEVNLLETKYKTAQKEKEISEKKLAIEQQRIALKKKDIYLITAGLLLLLSLVAGVFSWRSVRQKQKIQQQQMNMLQKENELQATQAMMDGEEKERARIARNLHDGAGSMLSAARLYIGTLGKQLQTLPEIPAYRDTLSLLDDASAEIRETAHNLMPKILHEEGLNNAVEAFCKKFNRQAQLTVNFQSYGTPARYNRYFELLVYRTVQELINNSVKHAEASEIIVQLSFDNDLFSLTVEDNGKGFDLENLSSQQGLGISDLRQRMQAFNGNTDIQSSDEGTVVYIAFDLSPEFYRTITGTMLQAGS